MLESCKLEVRRKSTGEFPLEEKRDLDPSQDIHFYPFSVP